MGSGPGGSTPLTWQQAGALKKTNTEIQQVTIPAGGNNGITMRVDKTPYTDIRVRQALNMAVNRPLIAQGYYGGTEQPIPAGLAVPEYTGYAYPYNEWSQDLKDVYSYNIGKARNLMVAAGYQNGFETNVLVASNADTNLIQVLQAQFKDIGVNMTITSMDPMAMVNLARSRKVEQMIAGGYTSELNKPANSIQRFLSTDMNQNTGAVSDPKYDRLVADFNAATDESTAGSIYQSADRYSLEQAWIINVFPFHSYMVYQPRLKGYSGEAVMRNNWFFFTARWWIDQSPKK